MESEERFEVASTSNTSLDSYNKQCQMITVHRAVTDAAAYNEAA